MRPIAVRIACALVLSISLAGCAAFPEDELPKHGPASINVTAERPSIDYDLSFSTMGTENAAGLSLFEKRVVAVFNSSHAFASARPGIGGEPYHLKLSLDNSGNLGLAAVSGFICGLSLLVIPGYAKDEYTLVAEVQSGPTLVKRYQYHDSMVTWTQILLIFVMPMNFPPSVVPDVIDNMLWNLVVDMQRDGVLVKPSETAGPGSGP
jgi:hypothetical protein